jgi:hypothetical protein
MAKTYNGYIYNGITVICNGNGNPLTGKAPVRVYRCNNGYQRPSFKFAPGVFYTYSYNHAHRLRLEKTIIYRASYLEVTADILDHFWIQVAVLLLKPPLRNFFGSEKVTNL